jgi:hypothetical protein
MAYKREVYEYIAEQIVENSFDVRSQKIKGMQTLLEELRSRAKPGDPPIPTVNTFYKTLRHYPEIKEMIDIARKIRNDNIYDQLGELLLDSAHHDFLRTDDDRLWVDHENRPVHNPANIKRHVEFVKFIERDLARQHPKHYGSVAEQIQWAEHEERDERLKQMEKRLQELAEKTTYDFESGDESEARSSDSDAAT